MKVIVFVPGIMGSELILPNGTDKVWPPTVLEATVTGYRRTTDLIRSDLRVGDVISSVCIDFYGSILEHLAAAAVKIGGIFVPHPYDWRRDLSEVGAELGAHLDALVTEHGADTEIALVCHSMGGLVTRGWLERPAAVASPGVKATRLAVFLAVPHDGAPLAFARAIGVGGGSVGMSADDQRRLSGASGFPAAYQLFPPTSLRPIWRLDDAVAFDGLTLFDPSLVESQGLKSTHLEAAMAFAGLLDPDRKPSACRYFAVASGTHKTLTRFDMRAGTVSPVTVTGTGDGTVPVRSATALPVQTAYVDADHVGVTQHANTHSILSMLLGAEVPGPVAASAMTDEPMVSVSPKFATVGEDYELVVLPGRAAPFTGAMAIEQEQADDTFQTKETVPVAAASPGVRTIAITGPALPPGRYRVRLLRNSIELAKTDFVMMQRPPG
jgi:phospholipase A1